MCEQVSREQLSGLLAEAARIGGCIRSLSTAAELVQTGSGLPDQRLADTIVYDIFTVIGMLAGQVEEMSQ